MPKAPAVKSAEPRPVGRPTDYEPAMCERVIGFGKEGFSLAEMASGLDCGRDTMIAWQKLHPEFSKAVKRASDESLAWWEKQARQGLPTREFNSSLWGKSMSGRFPSEPYRDRVIIGGDPEAPLVVAEASTRQRAKAIAAIVAKNRG